MRINAALTCLTILTLAWTVPASAEDQPPADAPPVEKPAAEKPAEKTFKITVTIPNARSDNGTILMSLFRQADGFPGDAKKAFAKLSVPIGNGRATAVFDNVPEGTWAIGIIHDENGNLKMDRYGIGIPKEGVGASNNRKILAGPPKFKGASFEVKSDVSKEITLKYF